MDRLSWSLITEIEKENLHQYGPLQFLDMLVLDIVVLTREKSQVWLDMYEE